MAVPEGGETLPSQLKASLSYLDQHIHDLSEDQISYSIQLARELLGKLNTEEHVREQTEWINISLPYDHEPGFRVEKDRLAVHLLFGKDLGSKILEFGYHPFHAIAIVLIYSCQMAIFLHSLFRPTPDFVVWTAFGMQCYLTFWIVSPVHVDIARAQAMTFEIWYLGFTQLTLFCILIPISVRWDARGAFSLAHGLGCFGAYFCDAMPPIASECIRLGWMAWVCVAAILSVGYHFDYFYDFSQQVTWLGAEFDLAELILSRCLILGIFGFRYCYTFWHYPRDCMYFKVALVRSDQHERFVILRELGLLPMKSHRRFTDHSDLSRQEFQDANKKSSAQAKSRRRSVTGSGPEPQAFSCASVSVHGTDEGHGHGHGHPGVAEPVATIAFEERASSVPVIAMAAPQLRSGSEVQAAADSARTHRRKRSFVRSTSAAPSYMFEL